VQSYGDRHYVAETRQAEMPDFNSVISDCATPLYMASQLGSVDLVSMLPAFDAEVNAACPNGQTPLYVASANGHAEIVERLLKAGANASAVYEGGVTALYAAAFNGHADVVRSLVSHGRATVDATTDDGRTALHSVVSGNHISTVDELLSSGADITAECTGNTNESRRSIISILNKLRQLSVSENYTAADATRCVAGTTPVHIAVRKSQTEILELLLRYRPKSEINGVLLTAVLQGGGARIVRLLLGGITVGNFEALLSLAASLMYGHFDIFTTIVEYFAGLVMLIFCAYVTALTVLCILFKRWKFMFVLVSLINSHCFLV